MIMSYIISIYFNKYTLHVLCIHLKNNNIIHACIIIFGLYSLPYFICFIGVILNTLYAFYDFMYRCFTLVCRKIAQR